MASSACSWEIQYMCISLTSEQIQGKKQPSPESVFALDMSECPGLVQGGSLHWEIHAPGVYTGESQIGKYQRSACSQQVRIIPNLSPCLCRLHSAWHPQEVSGRAFCTVLITSWQHSVPTAAPALRTACAAGAAGIKVER